MNVNIINSGYMALAFLFLFGSAEWLYHRFNLKAEVTRKYVHIFTGVLTMLFPVFIQSQWLVLLLCLSFLVILLSSLKFNLLPSINGVERVTRGSILYPIVVFISYSVYINKGNFIFFYIPILVLAFCDPIAAFIGKKWPMGSYKTFGFSKTLSGSFSFFMAAFITSFIIAWSLHEMPLKNIAAVSFVLSIVTTFAEAITHKGYDNLSIPFSALAILLLMENSYL